MCCSECRWTGSALYVCQKNYPIKNNFVISIKFKCVEFMELLWFRCKMFPQISVCGRWLGHGGALHIRGLSHRWIHSQTSYVEVRPGRKRGHWRCNVGGSQLLLWFSASWSPLCEQISVPCSSCLGANPTMDWNP